MANGDTTDVTSTLTDLERKLVDLERELSGVTAGPRSAPEPPARPAPDAPAGAGLRVDELRGEIAGLVRFRDELEAAARQLVSEYDRLVSRLAPADGQPAPAAATGAPAPSEEDPALSPPPPAPVQEAALGPAPAAPTAAPLPAAVAAGLPGSPQPAVEQHDDLTFSGPVIVDAGPFTDITTLQAFEQAMARIDGAEDVYVRSFEGDRALIDVRLSNPVPLVRLLREQLPMPMMSTDVGEGRLSVDVTAAAPHGT
jgi:hypothetical protein